MAIDIFQSLKNCVFDLQRADVQKHGSLEAAN